MGYIKGESNLELTEYIIIRGSGTPGQGDRWHGFIPFGRCFPKVRYNLPNLWS